MKKKKSRKISHHRRVRKYLNFFKSHFDFKTPYEIIVEETFCLEALTCQLNFREKIPQYLEDESLKISTTTCVIQATKKLGQKGAEALKIVKELEVRTCDHGDEPVSSTECLFSLVKKNNPDHLFVATQNPELVNKCRSVASVPLLYVFHNFACLANPESSKTYQVKRKATEDAPNPKKKKPNQAEGGSNPPAKSTPHKDTSVKQEKNEAVQQYRKKVPDQNQEPGQEQKPKRKATEDAPDTKKKPNQAKGGSNLPATSSPHKDMSVNQEKDKAVKQHRKKVPNKNPNHDQEQKPNPFQLQKPNFKPLNSNVGHQKKLGGYKGKTFSKQFKKEPM